MDGPLAWAVSFLVSCFRVSVLFLLTGSIVACANYLFKKTHKGWLSIALAIVGLMVCSLLFVLLWFVLGWGH